ncbi:MAG: helix-hairpin-helix domain-containing protein [Candidatus Jettenia sp.]|nr:helix-hairpin-helix domain-containing protein [Candidatus Jettenia sp.]
MHILRKFCSVIVLVLAIAFVCQTICMSDEGVEGKVNINIATEDQIALLPGIGPKIAIEVVNYRTNNGNFQTIDDMKKVKGVGDKKFEKIKNFIAVEGDTTVKSTKVVKVKEPK